MSNKVELLYEMTARCSIEIPEELLDEGRDKEALEYVRLHHDSCNIYDWEDIEDINLEYMYNEEPKTIP